MPDTPISSKNKIKIDLCTSGEVSRLDLSGACALVFKDIAVAGFTLNIDGASSVALSGKADVFEADIAGTCTLKAVELKTKATSVSVAGTGKADVFASEKLTVNISGLGAVNYYGEPKEIVKDISLLGQLNKK